MRATLGLVAALVLLLPACERLEGAVPQMTPGAGVPEVSVMSLDAAPAAEGANAVAVGVVCPKGAAAEPPANVSPETTSPEAPAPEAPPAEAPAAAAPPPEVLRSPARIACERDGGSFARVGTTGSFACVRRTRDSGKTCDREGDCEGLCLARSRTCAPVKPLFGCQEILQQDGLRVTQCLE